MPGRQSAWRGRLGFERSRKISPLTFKYAPVRPSCRQSACLPSVRYSGTRYSSHSAGGSTTWLSPSKTTKSFVALISPHSDFGVNRDRAAYIETPARRSGGPPHRRLRAQRGAHFLVRRPPVGALDLGNALADDVGRRLHLVEAAGVGAQELGLILLRQPVFLHGFDGAPSVIAVMVIDIRRPAQDIAIEFREPRGRRLVALKASHAMLKECLARQALQRRQLSLVLVKFIRLIALVDQEAKPGRGGLEHSSVDLRVPLEKSRHQDNRDPERRFALKILHIGKEGVRQPGSSYGLADQFGAGILLGVGR